MVKKKKNYKCFKSGVSAISNLTKKRHFFSQCTMARGPARTESQSVSMIRFATGSSHLFSGPVTQPSATMTAVSDSLGSSTAACRTTSLRCWSCVSARLQMRTVWEWKLSCTPAPVETSPGSVRIRSTTVLRMVTAGTILHWCCRTNSTVAQIKHWKAM